MAGKTSVVGHVLYVFYKLRENLYLFCVYVSLLLFSGLTAGPGIITLINLNLQLKTPMNFFLKNSSLLDVFPVSVLISKFMVKSHTHNNSIYILGYAFQLPLMTSFSASEIFVLTAMFQDHHVAICCTLNYEVIMNDDACVLMASVSWATGELFGAIHMAGIFSMPFCGSNVIPQFFCDVPSLLKIFSSQKLIVMYTSIGIGTCLCTSCFICIMIFYFIFSTVLKIPTSKVQSKAFSICLPHLFFTVFMITTCFVYLKPPSNIPSVINRLLSVICTMIPAMLNPVFYSLRNND
uniref:Olfactory receptor family 14 subfamily A member 2 n=1 Tax=Otolemur garnettii TaxID=30611 RepID=H0XHT0_OTOGA